MMTFGKKDIVMLLLCYVFWGFQPLYWPLLSDMSDYTVLAFRIIAAAVFSVIILAATHRLGELKALLTNKNAMKYLAPSVLFLLADWAVFIVVVNAGHIIDASLGYYINPIVLFIFGVVVYKEKCTKLELFSLAVAGVGVIISTAAFGEFPFISLVIAVNWALYATIKKKNVRIDGVLSIAAETLLLTPVAVGYLLIFGRSDISALNVQNVALIAGSGIITALPMFFFSNSVFRFPLIVMCFAQYLSPTFNLICGSITGEKFSPSQLVSFGFFITAIVIFTAGEIRKIKQIKTTE